MLKRAPLTVFLLVAIALSLAVLFSGRDFRLPGNDSGYEPAQPIAFSHRLHAGELEVPCLYCHSGAQRSRNAGIPPLQLCMNCHKTVSAPFAQVRAEEQAAEKEKRKPRKLVSPEIRKIYAALGLDDSLSKNPAAAAAPVFWRRVHNLPDFVYFDHRPHVGAGVACQSCHGPVEAMERVRQHASLTMGWCVDCHRGTMIAAVPGGKPSHVSIDCSRCHY
jgi:hypothetical protein